MTKKNKSRSSKRWIKEHFKDIYVKKSKENNIRSRAWFKLEQIDLSNKIFKVGMNVLDLGSSPGSWSQYVRNKLGADGRIVACDVLPMKPILGVDFFQLDFCKKNTVNLLLEHLKDTKFHVVISDIAPNITGNSSIDIPCSIKLCQLSFFIAQQVLHNHGTFLIKSFQGDGFNKFYEEIKIFFSIVKICKPKTSRKRSREIFILATK